MGLGTLRALALDLNFSAIAHGVPAIVTVPDQAPIETRVIWLTTTPEDMPPGAMFTRSDPRRVMALRRDEVASVPVGTVIVAPEKDGDDTEAWVVDGHERQEADHNRVIVRRQCEA